MLDTRLSEEQAQRRKAVEACRDSNPLETGEGTSEVSLVLVARGPGLR